MSNELGRVTEKNVKLDSSDRGKPIEYTFNEGVQVVFIPPDQVFVNFTVLGLVFNDLFRFIPAYNNGGSVNHEKNFENRAIAYAQSIYPDIRVKRASQVKLDNNNNVQVHLYVQKYPNHITEEWKEKKQGLPYAGYKSRSTDIRGYGKGASGEGFIFSNVRELDMKEVEKTPDLYAAMKNSVGSAPNPLNEKVKTSSKLYRLKEGRIGISKKLLDDYFEEVDET